MSLSKPRSPPGAFAVVDNQGQQATCTRSEISEIVYFKIEKLFQGLQFPKEPAMASWTKSSEEELLLILIKMPLLWCFLMFTRYIFQVCTRKSFNI